MKNSVWNIVSIAVILLLSITAWYLYGANKANYDKTLLLTKEKNVLETSIAKIAEQKKSLEDKLASLTTENVEALAKIDGYSAKVEAMTAEYKTNMEGLTAERDKLRSEIAAFDQELADKNSDIRFLKKSLKKIDKKLQEAGSKNGSDPVSLEPIVITKLKNVSGSITEVNKDYDFVIINLGSDDGLSAGDTLFVSRKKALLGKVVVEKMAQKYSVAKILYKSLGDVVKNGDTVTN